MLWFEMQNLCVCVCFFLNPENLGSCAYPTLNVLIDWSLAIIKNDWLQMLIAKIARTAACMAANIGGWTRCWPFTIIIAPNRTARRKELRLIETSIYIVWNIKTYISIKLMCVCVLFFSCRYPLVCAPNKYLVDANDDDDFIQKWNGNTKRNVCIFLTLLNTFWLLDSLSSFTSQLRKWIRN